MLIFLKITNSPTFEIFNGEGDLKQYLSLFQKECSLKFGYDDNIMAIFFSICLEGETFNSFYKHSLV